LDRILEILSFGIYLSSSFPSLGLLSMLNTLDMLTSTTSRDPLVARAQIKDASLADIDLPAILPVCRRLGRFALEHGPLDLYWAEALGRKMPVSREAKQRQQFIALQITIPGILEHSTLF
jgi:hypothetical protein